MNVAKGIAWFCIFVIGVFVLGALAVLVGGAWKTVAPIWIGTWVVIAVLLETAEPTRGY